MKSPDAEMTEKEIKKAEHIESFYTPDLSLVQTSDWLGRKTYFVCLLRASRNKKGKITNQSFQSMFRTSTLDSAIFVYNNSAWFDALGTNRLAAPFGTHKNDFTTEFERWFTAQLKEFKPQFNPKRDMQISVFLDNDDDFYG